jgi:hypothetical protein
MVLKAEQHSQIAAAYEKAAADKSLPGQTREAFARKADWFRLLARVGEKRERAALIASKAKRKAQEPTAQPVFGARSTETMEARGAVYTELSLYASEVIARGACQSMGSATRSNMDGSSFSGLFTRVEIGHMVMASDG